MHMRCPDDIGRDSGFGEVGCRLVIKDLPPTAGWEPWTEVCRRAGRGSDRPKVKIIVECCCYLKEIIDGDLKPATL